MTPEQYAVIRAYIKSTIAAAYDKIRELRAAVDGTLPDSLRPATANDIRPGAIIWYKEGYDGPFWAIVEEVLRPDDPFKAYTAEDGSRYGLDDAWVTQ